MDISGNNAIFYLMEINDDTIKNAFGIYIAEEMSSILLPHKSVIIVNIHENIEYNNNPIIALKDKRLFAGMLQDNNVINMVNGHIYKSNEVIILGEIVKHLTKIPKLINNNSNIMIKYFFNLNLNTIKYNYLYKLFCS